VSFIPVIVPDRAPTDTYPQRMAAKIRDRLGRVRAHGLLAIQAGLAAGLSWFVAHDVVGHRQPFFAPVASVVALGAALGQRLVRVVELVLGVAVGVLVGDALVYVIGTGALQLSLVVALAVAIAVFVRGSPVIIIQASSSAVLIATLQPPTTGLAYPRFFDALIGGGIGIVITALFVPTNPVTVAQRAAEAMLGSMADGIEAVATALDRRDRAAVEEALERLRDLSGELTGYQEALTGSREAATISPVWWRYRDELVRYSDSAPDLDRAVRNCRVLARRAVALLRDDEPVPTELLAALDKVAAAMRELARELEHGDEPTKARELMLAAVRDAAAAQVATLGFSGAMMIGQVRFAATDLLRATGLDRVDAEKLVRAAATPPV
jgi:uncharacterized membrane protein YgaE (UPF0421/DUF939 family)